MFGRIMAAIVLLTTTNSFGSVFSYECDLLPLDAGWSLASLFCEPTEWLEVDGPETVLVQQILWCEGYDPPEGQALGYEHWLTDQFDETSDFFVEWRVETDGDSDGLSYTTPVNVFVKDGGVDYHFTIADDLVRYIRDLSVQPSWYFDIEVSKPHTYRVEFFGADWFVVYIDGQIVDEGVPEGPMVSSDTKINFRAKAWTGESTTVWRYIRAGAIPLSGTGDYTSDGEVNEDDLYFFAECFRRAAAGDLGAWPGCDFADFNGDQTIDCFDWDGFADAWTEPGPRPEFAWCPNSQHARFPARRPDKHGGGFSTPPPALDD